MSLLSRKGDFDSAEQLAKTVLKTRGEARALAGSADVRFAPKSDRNAALPRMTKSAISGHVSFRPVAWLMYLKFEPARRDMPKSLLGGRLMPSAGILLRPSFLWSIHARIARDHDQFRHRIWLHRLSV
jgi:hypothetical protein